MKYANIPTVTCPANYVVNMGWDYIFKWLNSKEGGAQPNLDPDFQRTHVWTKKQQISYVEFALRGGATSAGVNRILFNCVGWMSTFVGPFELVDGKQRLEAVRLFLTNKNKAFGYYCNEYTDRMPSHCEFIVHVNNLSKRADVLKWYIELNSAGTNHTTAEINKVKALLKKEHRG